jgi:integrase
MSEAATMGRATNRLSVKGVESEAEPGLYCDGNGLYLQVSKTQDSNRKTKAWVFRYMIAGRARKMGLGDVERVSLKDARKKANAAHSLVVDGVDPIDERDARKAAQAADKAKALSFAECAQGYIAAHQHEWKSAKHGAQWDSTLRTFAYPVIGKLRVGAIETAHVVKVLEPIWKTKGETARRLRSRIEMVLDRAAALKLRTGDNPARLTGELRELLGPQIKIVKHHEALPYVQLPSFMAKLRQRDSVSARALEWTVLTACRTGDTIGAAWSEIDLHEKTWTVPASRLKGKLGKRERDHVVPLPDRAIAILKALPREGEFLFPGAKEGAGLSNMAMAEVLKEMGAPVTVHGFRSTFRDWAAEQTSYPHEMAEIALAHTVGSKVERAYRRGDMREKRRRLMQDWADFCGRAAR